MYLYSLILQLGLKKNLYFWCLSIHVFKNIQSINSFIDILIVIFYSSSTVVLVYSCLFMTLSLRVCVCEQEKLRGRPEEEAHERSSQTDRGEDETGLLSLCCTGVRSQSTGVRSQWTSPRSWWTCETPLWSHRWPTHTTLCESCNVSFSSAATSRDFRCTRNSRVSATYWSSKATIF